MNLNEYLNTEREKEIFLSLDPKCIGESSLRTNFEVLNESLN